jgi:hypothetical protein
MGDCLEMAEIIDGYRRACRTNALNWSVRNGQGYELSSISERATTFLSDGVGAIPLLQGMEIAILNPEADGGLPHTRPPNLICLPSSLCKEEQISKEFRITLVHEAIHVSQRQDPSLWENFCRREGWTPVPIEKIPDEIVERCRINPDTISNPFWAWELYHVPLPLFPPHGGKNLSNTRIQWFDLRTGGILHNFPKSFEKKYGRKFGQPEHPYEIYAEIFSEEGISTREELLDRLN